MESRTSASKLYSSVVDDVIKGVLECFRDDNVDEDVLEELKQLWKTKLAAAEVTSQPQVDPQPPPPAPQNVSQASRSNIIQMAFDMAQGSGQDSGYELSFPSSSLPVTSAPSLTYHPNNSMIETQFTLLGGEERPPLSFMIQIPPAALDPDRLRSLMTPTIVTAVWTVPEYLAPTIMQQHIINTLGVQQNELQGCSSSDAQLFSLDGALNVSNDKSSNTSDGSMNKPGEEDGAGDGDGTGFEDVSEESAHGDGTFFEDVSEESADGRAEE